MRLSSARRLFACAALLSLAAAATACKETGTILVHSIKFNGVKAVDAGALEGALATKASSKLPWGKKRFFDRSQFDNDLRRIGAFYSDRGYPHARISRFDVTLNAKQNAVDVTLTIDEGDPVVVASINYTGFDDIPPAHFDSVKKNAPIAVLHPRDRALVLATRELALNELRDHGYPYATVKVDEDDGTDGMQAKLTFIGEPGKIAHFGATSVQGNESVSDHVVLREVSFKEGDLYRRSKVQDVQRRLYGMSLFQFVNVEPLDIDTQPDIVPTRITVAEGPHQRVNLSAGYGTEEQARLDAEYHRLNFLGGARSAGAHVRWSSLDRGVQLDFNQPYLLDPHVSLGVQGQQWYSFTPAYQSTVTGVTTTATYRVSQKTQASFSITSEHQASSIAANVLSDLTLRNNLIALGLDPRTNEQRGQLNALKLAAQHSTADNQLNARKGYQVAFSIEEAGRLLPGTFKFTEITADARHYLPLGSRIVFANRVQIANIASPADDPTAVPFSRRLFLGGATSVRGWGRYELSPLSDSGLPIGGNSMFAFTSEARATIRGSFGTVLFLDSGNVWENSWDIRLNDLRYAVGTGLRYTTPVGPLRFDIGYQLNPIPGLIIDTGGLQTRRWRMHFSIGQAF